MPQAKTSKPKKTSRTNTCNDEYEVGLRKWLTESYTLGILKERVGAEIFRLGFSSWSYVRLDIPKVEGIENNFGTDFSLQTRLYLEESFHEYDLILEHVTNSPLPLFQSDIKKYLVNIPFNTEQIARNKALIKLIQSFDIHNYLCLPLHTKEGTRILLTVCSKGVDEHSFYNQGVQHLAKLNVISRVLHEVGSDRFPNFFMEIKKKHENICSLKGFRLIEIMAKEDLDFGQAAAKMSLSKSTAEKRIRIVRESLNVKTTLGAIVEAVDRGYISL